MAFTHRSIELGNLDSCLAIFRDAFAYDAPRRKRLLQLWKELVSSGSCITVCVEDRRLPKKERIVGFGMSVFITDAFARLAGQGLPLLSRDFLEQWEKKEKPFLSKKEVALANAGEGLNLLILHHGWDEKRLTPEDLQKVRLIQMEQFIHQHAGYKVKEYLQEVYGAPVRDFVLAGGASLRHDYAGRKWKPLLSGLAKEDWPYLTGFRPEEALAKGGTAASILQAKATQPSFGFSSGEQEMLVRALEGKTDEELALALKLSHWTVKKRWQAVYLKVQKTDEDLLGVSRTKEKKEGDRGRQRRRYLLEYLRNHPEELRPRAKPGR